MSAFSNCQCDYRGGLVRFGVCVSLRRSRRENRVGGEVWGARAYRAAKRCGSVGMFYVRITPAVCRIAPNRTACAVFRSYSAGSRSPFTRSRGVGAVICLGGFTSGLCVSLWRSRRGYRGAGTRERGTGLAARPLCVFAQPHWHCEFFRGENAGAARPRLRQRVFDSLDSLHAAAGLCWCAFAPPSPGYTERPARL